MGTLEPSSGGEDRRAIEELLVRSGYVADQSAAVADGLIEEFGSFAAAIAGSMRRLRRAGADDRVIEAVRWFRSTALLALRQRAFEQPVIGSSKALREYLFADMSEGTRERFRTLYLNASSTLILDEETATGTVDRAPVYAREIVGRAIEVGATSMVLVHNHPGGDCQPSSADIDNTVTLARTCAALDISLLDHLIVGRNGIVSLRALGLLSE